MNIVYVTIYMFAGVATVMLIKVGAVWASRHQPYMHDATLLSSFQASFDDGKLPYEPVIGEIVHFISTRELAAVHVFKLVSCGHLLLLITTQKHCVVLLAVTLLIEATKLVITICIFFFRPDNSNGTTLSERAGALSMQWPVAK